ncbi:chaperone modulator CbpM [Bradyrhizobium sp.]|uniref:chaperone modulator CbpM n=1 Tax=Bradyrhizobium sp. TaxID=376 RepID=UPI003C4C35A6
MKLSKQEFLSLSGVGHETLNSWIAEEWLIPGGSSAEMSFSDIDIARARFIRDLKMELGVNDEAVGVILHLVDQLHGMRRTLKELREVVRTNSSD